MRPKLIPLGGALFCAVLVFGCDDPADPTHSSGPLFNSGAPEQPAPSPLETVEAPFGNATFWPYTGVDYSGIPQDPINLAFAGRADPRELRAALMFLDGVRDLDDNGAPDPYPFNCTWKDAIGGVQTAYGEPAGWAGSAIQLECGDYDPLRFHVRLFDIGDWTIANAHFDLAIPGTSDHQVISWELGQQLVAADFLRSGLLYDPLPVFPSDPINTVPFKFIPPFLYNELDVGLRAVIGGPLDDQPNPVPIPTNGTAAVLNVADAVDGSRGIARQEFVIQFGQLIPKPFCQSGPADFLLVSGPVNLRQQVVMTPSGNFVSQFHANGTLELTPALPTDPPTPIGETYRAKVNEHHKGIVTDNVTLASQLQIQAELPPKGPFRGRLVIRLNVGPGGADGYTLDLRCDP